MVTAVMNATGYEDTIEVVTRMIKSVIAQEVTPMRSDMYAAIRAIMEYQRLEWEAGYFPARTARVELCGEPAVTPTGTEET